MGCLTEQSMGELVQIIISTISEHFKRQDERNQKRKDEDYDDGVEDQVFYLTFFLHIKSSFELYIKQCA